MTLHQSDTAWRDDPSVSSDVRLLLASADADGPQAPDLDRLARRLAPALGISAGALAAPLLPRGTAPAEVVSAGSPAAVAATGAQGGSTALLGSSVAKLFAGLAVIGMGIWWWTTTPAPRAPAPAQPPVVSVPEVAVQPAPTPTPAPAAQAPGVEITAPAAPEPARARPEPERRARPVPALPAENAPSELALIRQAQGLRGQPAALLEVLAQHARLYPDGMLSQEREVLAIEALQAAGQTQAARKRAQRLEAAHPDSAHLPRVRALLGPGTPE